MEGDLVLKKGKVYVLKNERLRIEIIWLHHDILVAGYRGRWKTTKLVMRNCQWLGVIKDVGKYIEEYNLYQSMKNRTETPAEKLIVNEVLEKLQTHLMVDFITKLPLVAEKDIVLVMCDRLSKMVHFVATTKQTLVEGLVRDNV